MTDGRKYVQHICSFIIQQILSGYLRVPDIMLDAQKITLKIFTNLHVLFKFLMYVLLRKGFISKLCELIYLKENIKNKQKKKKDKINKNKTKIENKDIPDVC